MKTNILANIRVLVILMVCLTVLGVGKVWGYTVSFSTGSGNPTVGAVAESYNGAGITLPAGVTPVATGWEFVGWATASCSESTKAPVLYTAGTEGYKPGANITVYAVYRKYTTGTSSVTFDASDISNLTAHPKYSRDWTDNTAGIELYISAGQRYTGSPNTWTVTKSSDDWNYAEIIAYRKIKQIDVEISGTDYLIDDATDGVLSDNDDEANTKYAMTASSPTAVAPYTQTVTYTGDVSGDVTHVWMYSTTSQQIRAKTIEVTYYNAKFCSDPCDNIVTLSAGTKKNVSEIEFSETSLATCSGTAGDREVTVTVTPNSGYLFKSGDELTWNKTSGDFAAPTLVTGPTLNAGKYDFVYRFAQNANGAGNFAATASTYTNYRTQCCVDPALAYGTGSVTKTFGEGTFTNTLTNSNGVSVSYVSSVPEVATVASDGTVTIVGAGTTTITASCVQQTISSTTYCADEASYTLTVNKASISPTLTYSPNSVAVGDNSSAPSVGGNSGSGGVTYAITSASPAGCATINTSTGVVTGVAVGSVTVTATIAATDNYNGNTTTATVSIIAASYFQNGATVFIQADSKDYSAWKDDACVKAWFNASGAGGAAQTTYWLFDATDTDAGKKLFATVVPASGSLNQVTVQRFAEGCGSFLNANGTLTQASSGGVNTFRSYGSADNNIAWNGSSTTLSLYGSQNSWASSLATFTDQGSGVWTASFNNYAPDATSKDYKIKTSYNNGWIGNTGSNNNATLSGMIVGSTYNVTATLDVTAHSLVMSKEFVKGTVHFDLQGHGLAIADLENVTAGSKISAPSPAPSATGYTFGGWFKEPACTNAWNFASDVVNETMTLYAKWTAHEYTITKTLTNVTSSPAIPSTYTYTGAAAGLNYTISPSDGYRLPTEITVSGTTYTWNPATGALALTGTISSNVTITIVAVQTHTVTWKNNGENYGDPVVYDHGATLAFPAGTPSAPSSCSEKVFVGWTAHSEITSETSDAPELISAGGAVNADATYRAVFADASGGGAATYNKVTSSLGDWSGEYLIVHEVSSTSGKCMDGSIASGSIDANYNSQDVSISSGSITSTSSIETYRWIVESVTGGYNIKSANQEYYIGNTSQKNKAAANGLTTTESSSTDEGYVLTFAYSNSKTTIKASKNGDTYLVYNNSPAPADPVTVRFRFYKASTCGNGEGSGNYSAVALYKKTGGISYDNYITQCCALKPVTSLAVSGTTANSVTLSWTAPSPTTGIDHLEVRNASTDAKIGSDITNLATTTATISGLTECETYSYKIVSVGDCETSSDAIDAQPYSGAKTVTYKYHDDVTPDGSFTTDCDNTSTTLPNPSRTGYTLNGWYTEAEGGTKKGNGGASYTPDATITLHAQWSENNYTVTMAQSPSVGATLTGGTTTAHYGGTINISTDVPAGYRFTGWTADPSVTFADASATSTSFTMPASNVTVTANFVQIHTLTFVVPDGGGSAVTPPATADHGGTVTLPSTTGKLAEFSCETFLGWTTTAPNAEGGTKWSSTPTIKAAGATSDVINSNTTFYAVYSRSGGGASGTVELTGANIGTWYTSHTELIENGNIAYGKSRSITVGDYTWTTNGYQQGAQTSDYYLSLRERTHANGVSWIQIPTMPGDINTITFSVTNGGSAATTNVLYLQSGTTSGETVIASSENTSSLTRTIEVTGSHTSGYITANGTIKVRSITVSYGSAPIISHTLHCDCPITQFDLTYDANTANFPGSTTSCEDVDDYAWAAHDDIYTICATEPTCAGYKFIDWTTNANGSGDHYNAGQEISCVATADVTLYAQYERVYTVTFDNQGVTTPVTQDSYGATIAVPAATDPCDEGAEWAFVGWSETAIAPMSFQPTIEIASGTSTYTPTADKTLYAIYRKSSESSAFVPGMSGAYKIKATVSATDYYAGAFSTERLTQQTSLGNAVTYYIKYTSADGGKYTIQSPDGKYIAYKGNQPSGANTDIKISDDAFYWRISSAGGGLWAIQSPTSTDANTRYIQLSVGTGFKAYTNNTNPTLIATDGQFYYRNMSCASDFDITFHANGATINWADGYPEAAYKDLVDATVVSTFPTATFDGWTFLGWRTADYDESPSAPDGIYSTGGSELTIASADVDLYPVFTRLEDNEPFDQINGGEYYMYYTSTASGYQDTYYALDGQTTRVYAASEYIAGKEMSSSTNCSGAQLFSFEKRADGNWNICIMSSSGVYKAKRYLINPSNTNEFNAQATEPAYGWSITDTLSNQVKIHYEGNSSNKYYIKAYDNGGGSASATFQPFNQDCVNSLLYHPIYLGGCSERIFTTQPSNTPEIEIHGQAKVTSTATKSVKARTALTVTASDISTANLTVTSDNSAFKFCLTSNGTYTASVNIPVVSNKVGVTPIYLEYTPTATSDGIEGAIITVSDGAGTPTSVSTVAGDVQGRHLPANFVIAAKLDDRWYALPANCTTSTSSTAGILIEVDDVNDPTTATLAPDYTKYGLREVASTRYAANGANVTFVEKLTTDPAKEYTLYNGSTTSVQVNAQWSGYYTTNPERYEWILNSDDFEDYTITSATTLATDAGPRTVSLNTSGVWGTLLNSKSYDGKVRLLPATFYEESPAQIVEWKASAVVVMYTGTETSATTKVGTGDASSSQTLSTRKLTHGVYELSTDAFASNEGKILWLYFGDTKKAFEIPWIITGTTNAETGHDKHDVVITKTGKLSAVSTKYSFRNVYVYGGGKLKIASGTKLGVNNIILRAGGITTSGIGSSPTATYEYVYPQVELGGELSSTKTDIKYEYITDYDHWYQLCLPFNASLNSITYPQEYYGANVTANNTGSWIIKRYAGEVRATGSYEAWKDIEKDSPAKTEVTAGFGYIFWGAPKKVTIGGETQRQQWGVQRMTMSITAATATTAETSNKNISVDSYTEVATSTKPNDQGWNLVGNPYMVNLSEWSSTSMIAGELVHSDTDPWDGKWKNSGDGVRYVTIPDNHFDNYVAKTTATAISDGNFMPGRAFFVQIDKGATTLTFAAENRASLMPVLFAKTEQSVDIETGIVMSDESKHDEVNFWIKDGKTAEYEYNADYPKTPNNSHFNLYGVHEHGDLSWIAISPEIAEGSMAIGYQVPTAGEYRLSLSETYISDKIEQLLVTDHEMSPEITTDLMAEDYIFQVNHAETNNTRFTVSIKIKSGTNTATDIDDIRTDSDHPIKFLYRDKIYILRGGNIYDTTGKQVKGGAQ